MLQRMNALVLMVMVQAGGVELQLEPPSRFEVVLFPAVAQVSGKFTEHVGTYGTVTWRWKERFGLQLFGGGNWHTAEGAFAAELTRSFSRMPQHATAVVWTWGVLGGFELTPLLGELRLFEGVATRVGFSIGAAVGAGGTRLPYLPNVSIDTGTRLMGSVSLGLRVALAQRFTLHLEVRDVLFSSHVVVPSEWVTRRGFVGGAPTSDVLHNVGLYVGAGVVL